VRTPFSFPEAKAHRNRVCSWTTHIDHTQPLRFLAPEKPR
jgi:hypothetical protein